MQSITLTIFNLIENFLHIINNEHYIITCAKYNSSNMSGVHTICPANKAALPTKVVWLLFEKEYNFCMAFVLAISQLTQESAHEVFLKYDI